jgi:ComEC/Rec2-related protein
MSDSIIRVGDVAFWVAVAFLVGVLVQDLMIDPRAMMLAIGSCATTTFLIVRHAKARWLIAGICFAFIAGMIYCRGYGIVSGSHVHLPTGSGTFLGIVSEEPKPVTGFVMLTVSLAKPYSGMVDVFTPPPGRFIYGDLIQMTGRIDAPKNSDEHPALFLPHSQRIAAHKGWWLKEFIINAKAATLAAFYTVLPRDQAGLLEGIIFGSSDGIDQTLKAQMSTSGTSYIIGMYGYKIALLIAMARMALKDHVSRMTLFVLAAAMIGAFVLWSGASVSALRAGVMGIFSLTAGISGRVASPRNALTAAAFVLTVAAPGALVEAGFQLSFLSFLGIFFLSTPLKNFFRWTDAGFLKWKEHAVMSLATNLAIIPVAMKAFGDFSLPSLISNTLIMVPWPLIVLFGLIMLGLGLFSHYLTLFVAKFLGIMLAYELLIIKLFTRFVIPTPVAIASWEGMVLFYGSLFIFIHYYGTPSAPFD